MSILSNLRRQKRQLASIANTFNIFADTDKITTVLLYNPEIESLEREFRKQILDLEGRVHKTIDEVKNTKAIVEIIENEVLLLFNKFSYLTQDLLNKDDDSLNNETDRCIQAIQRKITVIENDLNRLKVAIAANLKGEVL